MRKCLLTGLFLQKLLELVPFILSRLLHQMRPDAAHCKISHVHLHQVQHGEYGPLEGGRQMKTHMETQNDVS